MLTPEILLAAGYREDVVPMLSSASRFFQRRVTDERGTRYFIDAYFYAPIPQISSIGGFDVGVYLEHTGGQTSETRFHSVTDLAFVEQAAEQIWTTLQCPYREADDV